MKVQQKQRKARSLTRSPNTSLTQTATLNVLTEEVFNKRLMEFTLGGILGGGVAGPIAFVENRSKLNEQEKRDIDKQVDELQGTRSRVEAPLDALDPEQQKRDAGVLEELRQQKLRESAQELGVFEKLRANDPELLDSQLWSQAVEVGERSNISRLQQIAEDFPELAPRVEEILKRPEVQEPVVETEDAIDAGGDGDSTIPLGESDGGSTPPTSTPTETFEAGTDIEWDVPNGNEFRVKGKVIGLLQRERRTGVRRRDAGRQSHTG